MPRRAHAAIATLGVLLVFGMAAGIAAWPRGSFAGASSVTDHSPLSAPPASPSASASASASPRGSAASDPPVGALAARAATVDRQASLTTALTKFAASTSAQFAVAVVDHRTGTAFTYHGDQAFPEASVVKVDILVALALQAQDAGRPLTDAEQDLADAMIRYSDNDAATALWWMIGGDAGLAATNARLGLTQTQPGADGYWGLTTTTVADQVRLLGAINDPAGPLAPSRDYILSLMQRVASDQNWGVSAAAGPGELVALKDGWLDDDDSGLWMVNSIGLVSGTDADATVVILSDGSATLDDGITMVEQIASLTRSELIW